MYFIEISIGSENSQSGHPFFLWSERCVAILFTIEYVFRWLNDKGLKISNYPKSALGIIDLIAILPFWMGFFVPADWLHMIRTLRTLRLLKFFRYNRSLQLVVLGFYRAWPQLKSLGFAMLIIGLFSMVAIYEAERHAQPDAFGNLFDTAWFTMVSVSTVGYGDKFPETAIGKIIAMTMFAFALTVFAGIVGVLGNSFSQVLEEEADPDIDPIELFKSQRDLQRKIRKINKI